MASSRLAARSRDIANVMQRLQGASADIRTQRHFLARLHGSPESVQLELGAQGEIGIDSIRSVKGMERVWRSCTLHKTGIAAAAAAAAAVLMARYKGAGVRNIASLNLLPGFFQHQQDEQESVQKRTFTKWINTHLAKRNPPMLVNDLFEDIKDGVMLIALLEVLSGQKLPCEQGRQLKRIHWVANIGTALKFLEGRRSIYRGSPIKLVNINSTDIADGRPSIVLGLVWTIILYFQIEELTSNLPQLQTLSSSTSSVESVVSSETASPPSKRKVVTKVQGSARKALLKWIQYTAAKQVGIEIKDFGQSWRSGVAFHSVIHAIRPDLVDMEKVRGRSNRENLEEAFTLAEAELGIPRLLDPEDVDVDKPDEKSVMTYVAQFLKYYPDPHHTVTDVQEND
ncbi:nesprin-1-like, partial [Antrostomus carolinensis]|uniref:nesprin-1-like n=1 Tax=Antrostomus carolinensis TaxID=279965 RepID=UPI0010A98C59